MLTGDTLGGEMKETPAHCIFTGSAFATWGPKKAKRKTKKAKRRFKQDILSGGNEITNPISDSVRSP